MTKTILVAFAVAFLVVTIEAADVPPELLAKGERIHGECIKETGVAEELIENAKKGEFADDEKLKCWFKCIMEKLSVIKDGDMDFDAMLHTLPERMHEEGAKTIKMCRDTTGKNLCERTYNYFKCFYEKRPEVLRDLRRTSTFSRDEQQANKIFHNNITFNVLR